MENTDEVAAWILMINLTYAFNYGIINDCNDWDIILIQPYYSNNQPDILFSFSCVFFETEILFSSFFCAVDISKKICGFSE